MSSKICVIHDSIRFFMETVGRYTTAKSAFLETVRLSNNTGRICIVFTLPRPSKWQCYDFFISWILIRRDYLSNEKWWRKVSQDDLNVRAAQKCLAQEFLWKRTETQGCRVNRVQNSQSSHCFFDAKNHTATDTLQPTKLVKRQITKTHCERLKRFFDFEDSKFEIHF